LAFKITAVERNMYTEWHRYQLLGDIIPMLSVPDEIKDTIIKILREYGAIKISIFGSFARGEERPESDIDIIVKFDKPKSLLQLIHIEEEIKNAVQHNIDLLTENSINPYLIDSIRRDEVVIYG
jgi:uncharacterized protein